MPNKKHRTLEILDKVCQVVIELTRIHILNFTIPEWLSSCPRIHMLLALQAHALNILWSREPGEPVLKIG